MRITALVRIVPGSERPEFRSGARLLLTAARAVRRAAGFRRWVTFRAMDASDALFVLVEWESPSSLERAGILDRYAELAGRAQACGWNVRPMELLESAFDRRLAPLPVAATLLRLSCGEPPLPTPSPEGRRSVRRDSDFALQALAAPGTLAVAGAASPEGDVVACRIDFDTDDALWHFLDSPLRRSWSEAAQQGFHRETWAINLPRLEYRDEPLPRLESIGSIGAHEGFSIQFSVSDDRCSAYICFQGQVEARGAAWCDKLCRALLDEGCRRLEVDVSGLAVLSPDALGMLTGAARALKERGGQFVLIDNEQRVKRVTRARHLAASVR